MEGHADWRCGHPHLYAGGIPRFTGDRAHDQRHITRRRRVCDWHDSGQQHRRARERLPAPRARQAAFGRDAGRGRRGLAGGVSLDADHRVRVHSCAVRSTRSGPALFRYSRCHILVDPDVDDRGDRRGADRLPENDAHGRHRRRRLRSTRVDRREVCGKGYRPRRLAARQSATLRGRGHGRACGRVGHHFHADAKSELPAGRRREKGVRTALPAAGL